MRRNYSLLCSVFILIGAVTISCKKEPLTGIENGHEWVDLGLSVRWATSNVSGEHDLVFDTAFTSWGGNWRLPTKEEFEELIQKCTWEWDDIGFNWEVNHLGYKISGKNKAYKNSSIFLPYTDINYGSDLYSYIYIGKYWSSTTDKGNSQLFTLHYDSTHVSVGSELRNRQLSIRLVCPKGEDIIERNEIAPLLPSDKVELILSNNYIFSDEKNKELENKILSFSDYYEVEWLRKKIKAYDQLGTFYTTVLLQAFIDRLCLYESFYRFLNDNIDKNLSEKLSRELDDWSRLYMDSIITELGISMTTRECSNFCKKYLVDRISLNDNLVDYYNDYIESVSSFINRQNRESIGTVKQLANMISYQMFKVDSILFINHLKNNSVFESIENGNWELYKDYYKKYFVDVAKPQPCPNKYDDNERWEIKIVAATNETQMSRETNAMRKKLDSTRESNSNSIKNTPLGINNITIKTLNNSGKDEIKHEKVNQFNVKITIAKNSDVNIGKRVLYLRIIRPDGEPLVNDSNNTFKYENVNLEYSTQKQFDFTGAQQELTMSCSINKKDDLQSGTYKAFLFSEGVMIGEIEMTLQ